VPVGGAAELHAQATGDVAVVARGELRAVVVPAHHDDLFVGLGAVRPGGRPSLRECRGEVLGSAPGGEGSAQERPVEAVDHRAEVGPAVLTAPNAGQVGLPEDVGGDDVERSALGFGMRPGVFLVNPHSCSSRATFLRFTTNPARRAREQTLR